MSKTQFLNLTAGALVVGLLFYAVTRPRTVPPAPDAAAVAREDSIRAGLRAARSELSDRLLRAEAREDSIREATILARLSPAARRIRRTHPWPPEACERLAARQVWIGMTYDMLVFLRGRPEYRNVANYGKGEQYQYCWPGLTPSCFYDYNADGVIDSYN